MNQFEDIIGHDNIKRYFNKAILKKNAHSFIFEAFGVGKKCWQRLLQGTLCENRRSCAA